MLQFFQCHGCSSPIEWNETPLCQACRGALIPAPVLCSLCGSPTCSQSNCSRPWAQHAAIRSYSAQYLAVGGCHPLLRKWKISGGPRFDRIVLKPYQPPELVDAIIPIPQRLKRAFKLGRSPAQVISNPIAHSLQIPVIQALSTQRRELRKQASLRLHQRIEAPQQFEAHPERIALIKGSVVLVDDFMTSGHTLRRAADVLHFHGVDRIHVFCLGLRPKIGS